MPQLQHVPQLPPFSAALPLRQTWWHSHWPAPLCLPGSLLLLQDQSSWRGTARAVRPGAGAASATARMARCQTKDCCGLAAPGQVLLPARPAHAALEGTQQPDEWQRRPRPALPAAQAARAVHRLAATNAPRRSARCRPPAAAAAWAEAAQAQTRPPGSARAPPALSRAPAAAPAPAAPPACSLAEAGGALSCAPAQSWQAGAFPDQCAHAPAGSHHPLSSPHLAAAADSSARLSRSCSSSINHRVRYSPLAGCLASAA